MGTGDKPYQRKNMTLEPPFRFINEKDQSKTFANELTPINMVNLSNLLPDNSGDRYVIIYEENEQVLAFIVLLDHDTYFEVELLEANRTIVSDVEAGSALMLLTEKLSKKFRYGRIELYSTQSGTSYYRNHKYELTSETIHDPVYGVLTKMIKNL